jgi:hypothetical protein
MNRQNLVWISTILNGVLHIPLPIHSRQLSFCSLCIAETKTGWRCCQINVILGVYRYLEESAPRFTLSMEALEC